MAPLLDVTDLSIAFATDEGTVRAVEGVSFRLETGKTLGIVGESGSGKSVTSKALNRLLPKNAMIAPESRIRFWRRDGQVIEVERLDPGSRAARELRGGEIGMIFQEPMASFSPVYTVGNQMIETIRLHRRASRREAREIAVSMLDKVGMSNPQARVDQYPHELSGGMRQRAMIALALSAEPRLLIADEPTTALDVTIQAQVLELMAGLQRDLGMAMIFITHDLGVIAQVADEVAVMYLGTIVERGPTARVIRQPQHPYTRRLLEALPSLDRLHERLKPVPGDIPSPLERPTGCPFHNRCPEAVERCAIDRPLETDLEDGRAVRCHLMETRERQAA